jgi:HPt (histidine-containing phosphotransfer) domain-containing protein/HAMP domain-containing protein
MKFRLLILTTLTLLLGAFVAAIVLVSDGVHERDARAVLATDLERSAVVLDELTAFRSTTLASALRVTADEPRLKAVVATDEVEHATVLDVATELKAAMKADVFLMVDGRGRLLADTAAPAEHGAMLDEIPVVARALREGSAEAVWIADDRAVQVAARRMAFGDEVVGAVVAGRVIDDAVAASIARQSGSVVVVLLDGHPIAVAGADPDVLDRMVAALAGTAADGSTFELEIGDARWVARRAALPGYAGAQDLSYAVARSLDAALSTSRELSRRVQQLAAGALVLAVALAFALARFLSRPLDRLVAFTRSLAAGQLDARAPVGGPRELRVLGRAMDVMATELASSRTELVAANHSLERTVLERTEHLRVAHHEVAEMLEHLDDAVLIVNRSLRVEPGCSPACAPMLGVEAVAGSDIHELLFAGTRLAVDAETLAIHAFVFDNCFGEAELQWELNAHLLLRDVVFHHPVAGSDRALSLRYAPLYDDTGEISRVMLVITDTTELLALRHGVELEQSRSSARVEALLAFSRCSRRDAIQFVDESRTRMGHVMEGIDRWFSAQQRIELVMVMRELHTLKGNARALGLKEISTRAHGLEGTVQCLLDPGVGPSPTATHDLQQVLAELAPALTVLDDRLAVLAAVADELLHRENERPRVDIERMQTWLGALAAGTGGPSVARLATMRALLGAEANERVAGVAGMLEQQRAMVDEVGEQLGRQVRLDVAAGCELFVTPAVAGRLRDAFIHAIRNAIDHGIETPDERTRLGKSPCGVISLRWRRCTDHWLLQLSDDGRGVDPIAIESIARRRGMLAASRKPEPGEIVELLFAPSFSSKAVADDISGRGVGLDAIRSGLLACGIRVELSSALGTGTTLELRVPLDAVYFEERDGAPVGDLLAHRHAAA